ncbi:hypothetical protein CGRA01v4_07649 [Colletotrichum graminicola]|uniref:Uncharacterized protein n=1 Tax=Colletotrichum graminicola (strain M1.001 / M2 / FGSC 10212) TaxID=645133 RepID=E3QYK7_COLGM|nr:uncharacterized protein GLRG_10824 [Colletotrichum graminicola M1.001]EFQ35945.1 hypothetical protein GLRG_10824 [Colletotrichum graminicola M1.001]WDK16366.1 hypothetical protein CGRA01v4_07649 [Colletotrichum graminicola]
MGVYNLNLLKDELSLSAWLAAGACFQAVVSLVFPARYTLFPLAVAVLLRAGTLVAQYVGIAPNAYLKKATLDRWSILFPENDGSRPIKFGDKPIAMFLVGIRSNHPLGRLHPKYRKLNDYMDDIYKDAEDNRRTNGYLGRTPDLIPTEYSQNNTLMSISYWKSIEELEAFARRPVHIKGLKFLAYQVNKSDRPHDLGVMHEVLVCPAGHWEGIYSNMQPWGLGGLQWPMPKTRAFQGPFIERDPAIINGMWGRMGNKIKQQKVDEQMAELMPEGI